MRGSFVFSALIIGSMLAAPVRALAGDDLANLRAQVEALKVDYDARIAALQARIAQLEAAGAAAPAAAVPTAAAPPPEYATPAPAMAAMGASGSGGLSAFNPAISMIIVGNYAHLSQDPDTFQIAGFVPSGGEVGPGERSFNVGESELTLSANVDPYFYANVTAAVASEGEIGIEEAYFKTLALPGGLLLKGGRFFSSLGYLNEVHAHAWDFIDQPLVYQAFFGGQFTQDGLQLKWLAPTVTYIELGLEAGSGTEFPATHRNRNGANAVAMLAHIGSDIGDSASWRAGLSWLRANAAERVYDDSDHLDLPVIDAFSGNSTTWVADATLKWAPHGNATRKALKVQGEYMQRKERGSLAFDTLGSALADGYRSRQSGWYLQSVYQFIQRWRAGARYDSLDSGTADIGLVDSGMLLPRDFPVLLPASPSRFSLMIDWSPSEFSRLRAQYAWDQARAEDQQDRQFFLQYIYSIGAHGAHKF